MFFYRKYFWCSVFLKLINFWWTEILIEHVFGFKFKVEKMNIFSEMWWKVGKWVDFEMEKVVFRCFLVFWVRFLATRTMKQKRRRCFKKKKNRKWTKRRKKIRKREKKEKKGKKFKWDVSLVVENFYFYLLSKASTSSSLSSPRLSPEESLWLKQAGQVSLVNSFNVVGVVL